MLERAVRVLRCALGVCVGFTASCGSTAVAADRDETDSASELDATTARSDAADDGSSGSAPVSDSGPGVPTDVCPPDLLVATWGRMDRAPLVPPNSAALLDLNCSDAGLTLAAATAILCQSTSLGDEYGNDASVAAWGESGEVRLVYDSLTTIGSEIVLLPGSNAGLEFRSADAGSSYSLTLSDVIRKDGVLFPLGASADDAGVDAGPGVAAAVDELYRALLSSYAPGLPTEPADTDCLSTQECVVVGGDLPSYLFIEPLGLGVWLTATAPPRVDRIDQHRVR